MTVKGRHPCFATSRSYPRGFPEGTRQRGGSLAGTSPVSRHARASLEGIGDDLHEPRPFLA